VSRGVSFADDVKQPLLSSVADDAEDARLAFRTSRTGAGGKGMPASVSTRIRQVGADMNRVDDGAYSGKVRAAVLRKVEKVLFFFASPL
jgi:hypothetical protein